MSETPPHAPGAGDVIAGRYALRTRLAAGGMASVWQATDTVLQREVAVKILHPHLAADATFVARFRAEAVSVARLRHPNIVAIYDTCSTDGVEAIVMELVRGRNLRAYLDEHGPLVPAEAVHIVAEAADALAAAHRAGLVHRDVKPANILIRDDGQVLVTDFGIAKLRSQPADLTSTGMMIGSVRYLSPEQVEGKDVDARTDVYALGIVLFEALTGRVPFQADTDAATALARLRQAPPRPRQLRPGVPRGLEDVTLRALAVDPAQRFSSAVELRAALLAAPTTDDPTVVEATGIAPRPAPPAPRPVAATPPPTFVQSERRWIVPTVLILVIATALGLAGVLFGQTEVGQDLFDRARGNDSPGDTSGTTPAGDTSGDPGTVVSVRDFDPIGGDGERGDTVGNAADGDPATVWTTEGYSNPLQDTKPGVGLLVERPAGSVGGTLDVAATIPGWSAQVFVGDDVAAWEGPAGPTGAPVDAVDGAGDSASLDLGDGEGAWVLLWFTALGQDQDGKFRAGIAEVGIG